MYLDFYGIKEKPFTLSPDPRYLFYSHWHKEALSQMIYAITQQHGSMVLTGDVGTGKTTWINALLHCLPKNLSICKINHTILSPKALIQIICREFGIDIKNKSQVELTFELHEYLESNHRAGKKSILILDEAQNLGENVLEEIRLLSNFEAEQEKFLQIILVGQPELDVKLSNMKLRQLLERVSFKFRLERLNLEETRSYINLRLKVAGSQNGSELFETDSINKIHFLSGGVPRCINILCDHALLEGYLTNSYIINSRMIKSMGFEDAIIY